MRPNPIPLITAMLCSFLTAYAQDPDPSRLLLKSGSVKVTPNITEEVIAKFNQTAARNGNTLFAIVQFDQLPSESIKEQLRSSGVELLDYIPDKAYTATISNIDNLNLLVRAHVRAIVELTAIQKMQPELSKGNFPAHSVKSAGTVDVNISFPKTISYEYVVSELAKKNFVIISEDLKDYRVLSIRVPVSRLGELAMQPFIEYVEAVPGEDKPLSQFWTNWGRDGVRATILNASLANGGRALTGEGVVVGFGDNADPQPHIDFAGRLITRASATYAYHGTHVAGIIGGNGTRNELRVGIAPKSTLISQVFSKIFFYAPAYVTDFGMVISNNSYGDNVSECGSFGVYNLYSRILDDQAFTLPELSNVFAGGNSGLLKCAPFPDSFRTILGGYQSAKNVLTIGNATPLGYIFQTSSRGPVRDGRIKPEIVSVGSFIESTVPPPFDFYGENTGTSMAAPAIAGGMALLVERFRQLHPGLNPKNALMKALVCNSGDDWGQPGPDYTHGFGMVNFWRAVNVMENNQYQEGNIATGTPDEIIINVPAGLASLKVMLYWNDPAAAAVSAQALVNNLDLEVQTPSMGTVLPFVLDTAFSAVKNAASTGVDNINNIEQVVIHNPAAGPYIIRVKPTSIAQNPSQEYFIVYDFVPLETKLMTPVGGETYVHGENMIIRWDSYGPPANDFTLEYSINNGANWTLLKNNIASTKREYFFTVPDPNEWFIIPQVTTDQALVRVSRNGTGLMSTSLPFVISDTINATLSSSQCEGYLSMDWTAVAGATGYEVMFLQGNDMLPVATVSNSTFTYTFSGLSKDSIYWATVRPLIGVSNSPGRRAIAVFRKPDNGNCINPISNNDIKIDSILSPARSGREFTSLSLSNATPVTIVIKNLDDAATSGNITATYILNGGTPVTHIIPTPNIPGLQSLTYTFTGDEIDLSVSGTYTLDVTISQANDPVLSNNQKFRSYKQLANPAILNLTTPLVENFDVSPVQSHTRAIIGLDGLDRFDFSNTSDTGRLRTFVNTGIAYSGNRAITLDSKIYNPGTTDSLTATYNLATFNAITDDVRLDFMFKNHGQEEHPANKVWVRGSDTDNWIEVYDLDDNQPKANGTFKKTASIEVSDALRSAVPVQNFSGSFQVRWGQHGIILMSDDYGGAGYTFDDIRLYEVTDDMQMISIDTPATASCALTTATTIKVTVRNSVNTTVTNIPVTYRVNGGPWSTPELIPSIPGNDTVQYEFLDSADLSAIGSHLIEVIVNYPTDTYRDNDTLRITIINSPVVTVTTTIPYLENFESGNGYWYTGGDNSSWEFGTPSSYMISRAASGANAWKTRLSGNYNDNELSYLYSPCLDVSGLSVPTLSFSLSLDIENCNTSLCDGAYVQYSLDGKTWDTLGAFGDGVNWYNKNYASGIELWSIQNYTRWHVATIPLTVIPVPVNQLSQLRLRFVMQSDPAVNREGIAIDDIHVYDNIYGIYTGATMASPVTQNIPGSSNWVNFTEGGKLIASVLSTQPMGTTDAQAYIHSGPVRINSDQFYHNRNITIKPTSISPADSAIVRFYFTDAETEALISATGCSYCFKPSMAYELGVTKYSDADDNKENGTLADNTPGNYQFILPANVIKVPFDLGYYAEFKVKDFSEFWLNNGGFANNQPLPVLLTSFDVRKSDNQKDALITWTAESATNVDRFEIEVARGNVQYQQNVFIKIGQVASPGNFSTSRTFTFTDHENAKAGVRYYRLKTIDLDGSVHYSAIKPLIFNSEIIWTINPNPSSGIFFLLFQTGEGQPVNFKVYDVNGRVVKQFRETGSGFVRKTDIGLSDARFAPGVYLLEATEGDVKRTFRLLKQ